jgi:hypothetical protein
MVLAVTNGQRKLRWRDGRTFSTLMIGMSSAVGPVSDRGDESFDDVMIPDPSGVGQPSAGPSPVDTFLFESYRHPEAISDEIVVEVRFGSVEAIEPR